MQTQENPSQNQKVEEPLFAETKDISLRFKVDPDTNEVNVMLVDKESGKVLRSIPPEELENLAEGKLLEMFL